MITKLTYRILGICLFVLAAHAAIAQKASATLDRDKMLIGEQAILQVKLEDINPNTTVVKSWFNPKDTSDKLEFVKREAIDTVNVNGATNLVQKITITSFDSGRWALPELSVVVKDIASGKETTLTADPVTLSVVPVDVSTLQEYHDIKDIIEVEITKNPWIIIAFAVLLILLLVIVAIIVRRMIKKPKKKKVVKKSPTQATPLQVALKQLSVLRKQQADGTPDIRHLYTTLDHICREYIHATMPIQALKQTTDELMVALNSQLPGGAVRKDFSRVLHVCDAVKFAKYVPGSSEHIAAIEDAAACIQQIDQLVVNKK